MQPLALPERVSSGMSVTDQKEGRVSLGFQPEPTDRLMRYESIRMAGTRVPRVFPPGTPVQPLVLVNRMNEQRSVSERVERGVVAVGVGAAARSESLEPQGYSHRSEAVTGVTAAAATPPHLRGGMAADSDISQVQSTATTPEQTPTQTQTLSINVTTASPRSSTSTESSFFPPPRRSSLHAPAPSSAAALQDSESFLVERLASKDKQPIADMDKLQVRSTELSTVKTKAIEDARHMQARVIEECTKTGKDPPPYGLVELIGKGSFGRVYMG